MENIPQINTWKGLFLALFFTFTLYSLLKLLMYILENFFTRNITNKKTIKVINKSLLIFKLAALGFIVLNFIAINYITHTILLVVIAVFGYPHIKNFINGIFLKINPLVNEGAIVKIAKYTGEIKKLLPLGLILNTENGERFINYGEIEVKGFTVKCNSTRLLRETIYLNTNTSKEKILDLLFDNPILNYQESPVLKIVGDNYFKLQYTLEPGVYTKELISFLEEKNITTSLTNKDVS